MLCVQRAQAERWGEPEEVGSLSGGFFWHVGIEAFIPSTMGSAERLLKQKSLHQTCIHSLCLSVEMAWRRTRVGS